MIGRPTDLNEEFVRSLPDDGPVVLGHLVQEGRWDWVVLAQYPLRAAVLSMMTSPEYAAANVDREHGVEDHVILAANQTYSKFTHQ